MHGVACSMSAMCTHVYTAYACGEYTLRVYICDVYMCVDV